MTVTELKAKVEEYREDLKSKDGHMVRFSVTGPVGMCLIDNLVATIDDLAKRLAALEQKRQG